MNTAKHKKKQAVEMVVLATLMLVATAGLHAQNGTWTNLVSGSGSGSWANAVNWNGGMIATGAGSTADFSTLNITTNSTVTLDGARTIGNLAFGSVAPAG